MKIDTRPLRALARATTSLAPFLVLAGGSLIWLLLRPRDQAV